MEINGRRIGTNEPVYVIAELSANHNGSLDRAIKIITAAHEAGAAACKVQVYHPEKLAAARGGPHRVLTSGPWAGRTLIDLYSEGKLPASWYHLLQDHAAKLGITLFPSVFHAEDLEWLEAFETPAYKISSFDAQNLPLISACAATDKPLIISTGMASISHLRTTAVAAIHEGIFNAAFLHCVSDYPCPIEKANLGRIDELRYRFQVPVGFSDHTMGNTAAIAAVARGACIIEKHLTLSRADGGLDSSFSAEPHEFAALVTACNDAWEACQESEPDNAYKDLRVTA